jgi:hypothetical protein
MTTDVNAANSDTDRGPTYILNIEGVDYDWHSDTITPAQIRELAGWPPDQQVVLVDLRTNIETTLEEGTPVELKPGVGFGRKFRFKRGRA